MAAALDSTSPADPQELIGRFPSADARGVDHLQEVGQPRLGLAREPATDCIPAEVGASCEITDAGAAS